MFQWLRYYWAQIRQAHAKRRKDTSFRADPFIKSIVEWTALPRSARILCLGPRNGTEIEAWHRRGYWDVAGLDILPSLERSIRWGDMHCLPYGDWSYDLIYASHVLEHSLDFDVVTKEIIRVLTPGGYLFTAFPVHFEPTPHDRYDFKSPEGFLDHFAHARVTMLWEQGTPTEVALLVQRH